MLRKKKNKVANKRNNWRLIRISLIVGIITSIIALILELVMPLKLDENRNSLVDVKKITTADMPNIAHPESTGTREIMRVSRPGLFKSETSLNDKPMADKTIEMIRSQLKLQCIMDLNGERVAYVKIKDKGLKKCRIGDSVDDLFTVVNIDKESIEITIVGHKQILKL
jgi:hypothetical protein